MALEERWLLYRDGNVQCMEYNLKLDGCNREMAVLQSDHYTDATKIITNLK